jgi:hypothetical protein
MYRGMTLAERAASVSCLDRSESLPWARVSKQPRGARSPLAPISGTPGRPGSAGVRASESRA